MNGSQNGDRATGCLVGLAVGDALGTTVEFSAPGTFEPMTDIVGGGPFRLKAGQWTDDASMALCLAESLIECGGMDLGDQAERYLRWWREGHLSSTGRCFDIGNTVSAALRRFEASGEAKSGSDDPYSAGNGSIMRLAPVPMYFADADEAVEASGESSRTTHQARACVDACRYLGGVLWGLIHGESKEQVVSPFYRPGGLWKAGELDEEIYEIAGGSFLAKDPPEIRGTGYVVRSLEAAMWAFAKSNSFEEGALMAVNLGDDADTTGAIFGQIGGACCGYSSIPRRWRDVLWDRELIEGLAIKLLKNRDK